MHHTLSLTKVFSLIVFPGSLLMAQCPYGGCPAPQTTQAPTTRPAAAPQQQHYAQPNAHYTSEDDRNNYDYYYYWDDNGAEAEAEEEQEFLQTRRVSCPTTFLDCYEGDYDDSWYEFQEGLETDWPGKRDDPWLDELAR